MKTSIVVPAYNEVGNIESLIYRIAKSAHDNLYEIIVIDDHSEDGTWEKLKELRSRFPLKAAKKIGKKGKAYSLFEGLDQATGDNLAIIDADLQYPPEEIFPIVDEMQNQGSDVVVANRRTYQDSVKRKVLSEVFKTVFGRILFGINEDIQSGLKVFKREVYDTVRFKPKSKWSFDLEFLQRAKKAGYKLKGHDIVFLRRRFGKSKVNSIASSIELALNALFLRLKSIGPQTIFPKGSFMEFAGIGYKGKKYVTHSTLSQQESALRNLNSWQKIAIFTSAIFFYGRSK